MVSFFGIKFGSDKKKKHGKSQPDHLDQPYDGYGPNQGSRPGTAHSMVPPRGPYMNSGTASSLQDLTRHSRNVPSFSSLRPANSDINLGRKFGNGSTSSLVPPRGVGADASRQRSGSLAKPLGGDSPRPGTAGGLPRKSLVNGPADIRHEGQSRYGDSRNSPTSHSPLVTTSSPHANMPPQGPPPSSNLPAPPTSPTSTTPKSPLGQFQLQLNLPDEGDDSLMPGRPEDGDRLPDLGAPPRKDSLASLGSGPESPAIQSSPYIVDSGNSQQSTRQSGRHGSVATAVSARASDTSSFYSIPSPTRSSIAPRRESKESRTSGQYAKRRSHAHQYKLSLSTQNEDENEDKSRQSRSTKYSSNEHLDIDLSNVPSPKKTQGPPMPSTTGKNLMRLPSLHLDKTSLIPSPLHSPALSDVLPPIPSPVSSELPSAHQSQCMDHEAGSALEHREEHLGQHTQLHPRDVGSPRPQPSDQRDRAMSPPLSPRTKMQPPSLAPIMTNMDPRSSPLAIAVSPGGYDSDKHSDDDLCHSPTWEGFWGANKSKKEEKRRKKEEKKRQKEQKKAVKSGKRIISAPVPISVPESAASAPPLPSPILPGFTGDVKVTPSQRPDSPAVRAMSYATSRAMSPRVDSPMMSSQAMSSATVNTMLTTLRVDSPTTVRAASPAGPLTPSLRSPAFPPAISPPLGSARSYDGRFPSALGAGPVPAPGTPDMESPRKAPAPPSPATSPPLGSPRFQESHFSSMNGERPSSRESFTKAPSPPTSPRSVGTHSTSQLGRFDSIASHDSSVDITNLASPPKLSSQGLSATQRNNESRQDSELGNEPDLPRFSTIANSQFAPAPLSPAPRTIGLAPPQHSQDDAAKGGKTNEEERNRAASTPKSSPSLGVFQTPLLQQDGFSHKDQSPESASNAAPRSVERHQFDSHPPHMSPAFGGGPERHGYGRFSLRDDKSAEQSRLDLSNDDSESKIQHQSNGGTNGQETDLSRTRPAQENGSSNHTHDRSDKEKLLFKQNTAPPQGLDYLERRPFDTLSHDAAGTSWGGQNKDRFGDASSGRPDDGQLGQHPRFAGTSERGMSDPESSHQVCAPREGEHLDHRYMDEGYENTPMGPGRYGPEEQFPDHYHDGYGSPLQDFVETRDFGFQNPSGPMYGGPAPNRGPHPNEYHYQTELHFHDYGRHGGGYDERGCNDEYFDQGYETNFSGHDNQRRPFHHGPPSSYAGGFGDHNKYNSPGMSREKGAPSNKSSPSRPAPKQRTYKPFVPGAQVPDDKDVSDLVATPLSPSLKADIPRPSVESGRSMTRVTQAHDRNGSVTYGASWAASQVSPSIRREGFGVPNDSSSRAGHGTPTPPPSHAASGSPDGLDVRKQDFAMKASRVDTHVIPPTPSETPVDDNRDDVDSILHWPDKEEARPDDFAATHPMKSPRTIEFPLCGPNTKDQPLSPQWDLIRDETTTEDFSAPPTAMTFSSGPTETPTVRTFGASNEPLESYGVDNLRGSMWADGYDRESYVGSSLHSSFIDNYVHSWNGDLDQQYRERYPQFFSETGQPLFLGIADGGDDASMLTNSPLASPNPENKSSDTLQVPTVPEPSMDANWPLPAAPPAPREKKRPPPLKFDDGSSSNGKPTWAKVDEGAKTAPVGIGIMGSGLELPETPGTPRTPRSVRPRPKGQIDGRDGAGFI